MASEIVGGSGRGSDLGWFAVAVDLGALGPQTPHPVRVGSGGWVPKTLLLSELVPLGALERKNRFCWEEKFFRVLMQK